MYAFYIDRISSVRNIFVSPSLRVSNPVYVLPPASATDTPEGWAEVFWEK